MAALNFADILCKNDIDPKRVKLIRHAITDPKFKACYDAGMIYEYTCHQKNGFSDNYDYWAVFISDTGTLARFYAIYRVGVAVPDTLDNAPENLPKIEKNEYKGQYSVYNLEYDSALREYEEKLTIDWGKSARSWHQKGTNEKPIVSILPDKLKVFSGFENLVLAFDELQEIIDNKIVYDSWYTALSSVYAVYLIVDQKSGKQYVGSAYGEDGLLQRWTDYIHTHHGGNKKMIELLKAYPERYHRFQFSVLQILPKTLTNDSVISIENLYKKKLMTIEFGLNDN